MSIDTDSMRARAYKSIKEKIMTLAYKPGKKVSLQTMSDDVKIGKTPVHEALLQLNQEGLTQMIPQSGTYISKIDLQSAHEARFTRELIEVEIMQESVTMFRKKDETNIQHLIEQQRLAITTGNTEQMFNLDDEFHRYFYQLSQHDDMWKWLELFSTHLTRFRRLRIETDNLDWFLILEQHRKLATDALNHDISAIRFDELVHIRLMLDEENEVHNHFPDYFA